MFDQLKKHHLGFVIPCEQKEILEQELGKKFLFDPMQETHVLFVFNDWLDLYLEFICQEGRVKHHKPGYAHTCYSVQDESELEKVQQFINQNRFGFPLTRLEKSGSKECGQVMFYYLRHLGVIELNVTEEVSHSRADKR